VLRGQSLSFSNVSAIGVHWAPNGTGASSRPRSSSRACPGGGTVTDFLTGLIPSAQEVQRRRPVQNDNSINVNIGHAGSNADEVIDQVYNAQAAMARPGFRNTPR
jgi:hypothetical protein